MKSFLSNLKSLLWIIIIAVSIPVVIMLGGRVGIPQEGIIVYVVLAGLIGSWLALLKYASSRSTENDWWQDDKSSGWRGY